MPIKYGTPGYQYFRDNAGKLYAVRDYWYIQPDNRDYYTITVKNDARPGWVSFSPYNGSFMGPKDMTRQAETKAKELNERDGCILHISVTVI